MSLWLKRSRGSRTLLQCQYFTQCKHQIASLRSWNNIIQNIQFILHDILYSSGKKMGNWKIAVEFKFVLLDALVDPVFTLSLTPDLSGSFLPFLSSQLFFSHFLNFWNTIFNYSSWKRTGSSGRPKGQTCYKMKLDMDFYLFFLLISWLKVLQTLHYLSATWENCSKFMYFCPIWDV